MLRLALLLALVLALPAAAHADPIPAGAIIVNSPGDGPDSAPGDQRCEDEEDRCTLRAAIQTANAKPGADTIAFSLGMTRRIAPETPLPPITQQVTIDGFTQGGMGETALPQVEIDGSLLKLGAPQPPAARALAEADAIYFKRPWGLDLRNADSSVIRGLIVHDFPYSQIGLDGTDQATISGNWLGLDAAGEPQKRTSDDARIGLTFVNSAQAYVGGPGRQRNVLSGNDIGYAATDSGSLGSMIIGNYIGTTWNGLGKRPNHDAGILLTRPVNAPARGTRQMMLYANVVVGDADDLGIDLIGAQDAEVLGNFVGMNVQAEPQSPTGEPLGFSTGILVHDSPRTIVGGTGPAEFNLVAGNDWGIEVNGASHNTELVGNRVGTDYDGRVVSKGNRAGLVITRSPGGVTPADVKVRENAVAGSREDGIGIYAAQRVKVTANTITRNREAGVRIRGGAGTQITGNEIADNLNHGVLADGGGGDAVIGHPVTAEYMNDADCAAPCNRIHDNAGAGVRVLESAGKGITVRGNQMRGNGGLDVDLLGGGPTGADERDVDGGGNSGLNHPLEVELVADRLPRVGGIVKAADPAKLKVDVYGFAANAPLFAGRPRGGTYLGSNVPNSKGSWRVSVLTPYPAYAAVVTDADGSTSEVSIACADTTGDGKPDSDGDALCENWETSGIDYDGDGVPELPLHEAPYSADPGRPDIFVEVDYKPGFKPQRAALQDVIDAFALAPTPIKLHLSPDSPSGDYVDEQVPKGEWVEVHKRGGGRNDDVIDLMRGRDGKACDGKFGRKVDRSDRKTCVRGLAARKLAFRYGVFVDTIIVDGSGIADPGHDAFLVGLNVFTRDDIVRNGGTGPGGCNRQYQQCLAGLQAATFMHELGHTLGLHHDGDGTTELNYEPNYLSIMNYLYTWKEPVASRPLDFSRQQLAQRKEAQFDEVNAWAPNYPQRMLDPWTEAAYTTYVPADDTCRYHVVGLTDHPVQVDANTSTDVVPMGLNDPDVVPNAGDDEKCQETANQTSLLTSYDDWAELIHSRHGITGWEEGEFTLPAALAEAGPTELRELLQATDTDGDGIAAHQDVCPAVADAGQADSDGDGLGDACLPLVEDRDVEVELEGGANVPLDGSHTVVVTATNTYPVPAAGAALTVTLPAGVELVSATPSQGTFAAGRWTAGTLAPRATARLELRVRGAAVGRGELRAELVELGVSDWDSTPGNHDAFEDDQAALTLTVAAGAGAVLSAPDVTVREGDDDERTARVTLRRDATAGSARARVRSVDGGSATVDEDYEPLETTVELAPGQATADVALTVLGDALQEGDETVELVIDQVDGATPETLRATLTIADDDGPREPGQLGWLGCVSRDFGAATSCPQTEALLDTPVGDKALTPDGRFLFVPDTGRIVRFTRDAATGALSAATTVSSTAPADLAITPDGTRLIAFEPGNALVAYALDPQTGALTFDSTQPVTAVSEFALSPDGRHALLGGSRLTIVPIRDGHLQPARCYGEAPCEPLAIPLDGAPQLAWSPDGRTVAVRTTDHLALLRFDPEAATLTVATNSGAATAGDAPAAGSPRAATPPSPGATAPSSRAAAPPSPGASAPSSDAAATFPGDGPVTFAADGRALYVAADDRVTALPRTAPDTWAVDGPSIALGGPVTQLLSSPDGADVYAQDTGNGGTALRAHVATGALSAPRCALADLGVPSCDQAQGLPQRLPGRLVLDASGRDLYTVAVLPGARYGIGRFLRVTHPPGAENRAPVCGDATAAGMTGAPVTVALSCADPDGDPLTLRITNGPGTLAGTTLSLAAANPGTHEASFAAFDGRLDSPPAVARFTITDPPPGCAADCGEPGPPPPPGPPVITPRPAEPKLAFTRAACTKTTCTFTLRCTGAPCTGTLDLAKARARFTLAPNTSRTLKVKLAKAARKQLQRKGKLALTAKATIRLPDGRSATVTRKLTVKTRR